MMPGAEGKTMGDGRWYVARGGESLGPFGLDELLAKLRDGTFGPRDHAFTEGMAGWTPVARVPELSGALGGRGPLPPPPGRQRADEVDYQIFGEEMQFVEVELDPGESVVAEAGSMMFMQDGIQLETVFGDASSSGGGLLDRLVGAGKRLLTGESLFMTVFSNAGQGKARVAFAAPYPGTIMPVDLRDVDGTLICQKDAFLCAARGVQVGIAFQKKIGVALFGGEGFIMEKLDGDGLVFLHAGGFVVKRELKAGETLRVDTGCIVALDATVGYDIQYVGSVKSALFGGEGFFYATLRGPGTIWLQSLPFSRLAGRIWRAAPQAGGRDRDEGSVLGTLGGIGGMLEGR